MSENASSVGIKEILIMLAVLTAFVLGGMFGYGRYENANMVIRGAYGLVVAVGSALLVAGMMQVAGLFEPKED